MPCCRFSNENTLLSETFKFVYLMSLAIELTNFQYVEITHIFSNPTDMGLLRKRYGVVKQRHNNGIVFRSIYVTLGSFRLFI
jgi:hypothetical protein